MILALAAAVAVALQDTVPVRLVTGAPDSVAVLDFPAFYEQVRQRHPIARQAELLEARAEAGVLAARGPLWDPTLEAAWVRKRFQATEYFNYLDAALKLPTPVGVEFKLGFENTRGSIINPDRLTPEDGLWVAGVSIPIGRGMITDRRRNAMTQALAMRDAAVAERAGAVNKLLFGAAKDYAAWYEAWRRRRIADEGVEIATFLYGAVMQRFEGGDAAAIDTLEAGLELQRRTVAKLAADNDWYVRTQVINTYLWNEQAVPFDLAPGVVPTVRGLERTSLDTTAVDGWLAQSLARHPDLIKALAKQRAAEADQRLYSQELLPEIRGEAGILKDGAIGLFEGWPDLEDNYKYGLAGKTSLLLMKERGMAGAAGAKFESAVLEATLVRRELRAAVLASAADVLTFDDLLDVQAVAVRQARLLREGESRRFDEGESTLFLVNLRDRLLLEEEVKLAGFEAKYLSARAALAVALGGTLGDGRGLVPAGAEMAPPR